MSKSKTSSQETSPSLPPQAESCSWAQTPQAAVLPTTAAPIWGTHSRFLPRRTTAQEGRLGKARFPPQSVRGRWAFGNSPCSSVWMSPQNPRASQGSRFPTWEAKRILLCPRKGCSRKGCSLLRGLQHLLGFICDKQMSQVSVPKDGGKNRMV